MESLFVELAWKSVVTGGGALLLLHLLRRRTAAERSLVAHAGLVATLLLPLAVLVIPAWAVEAPAALPAPLTGSPVPVAPMAPLSVDGAALPAGADWRPTDLLAWAYLLPAALLLLATAAAVARLFLLRARASVLVDMPWLSALAHAQRRMGFKHGTALLVSDELVSPVSWGVMRPIILLNPRAVASAHEAEAIIAHELAHVARLDWAKLLAARLATALFWFNPLVWKLAAECHQLREEAADDAVLNARVDGPDYASLLVGAARHENKALLLAAHGVAPGKTSLSRRVARVLDQQLSRAPARGGWTLLCAVAAILLSAPLAALTPVAPGTALPEAGPEMAAASVAAAVTAVAPPAPAPATAAPQAPAAARAVVPPTPMDVNVPPFANDAHSRAAAGRAVADAGAAAATAARAVADASVAAKASAAASAVASASAALAEAERRVSARRRPHPELDAIVQMKLQGVTSGYAAELAAAEPRFSRLSPGELVQFRIHGVTPDYIRALKAAGYRDLSAKGVTTAAIMGVTPDYIRGLRDAGYGGLSLRELTNLRVHGVTPAYVRELRRAGYGDLTPDELTRLRIFGVDGNDLRAGPRPSPRAPRPPHPPRTPDG